MARVMLETGELVVSTMARSGSAVAGDSVLTDAWKIP
jgi:hypothetical protein